MSNGIKAWSWSRYADYVQCPRKAKYKHVDRMKEPGSKAMERGSALHDLVSSFITGKLKVLPKTLDYDFDGKAYTEQLKLGVFLPEIKAHRAAYKKKNHKMTVEDDWSFTHGWEPCRWDDWNRCWVRMKLDLGHPVKFGKLKALVITDWKSGKARDEEAVHYTEQLSLYATAGFIKYPDVDVVFPRLAFLDAGVTFPAVREDLVHERDSLTALKKLWADRTKALFTDTIFAAKPSQKCRWCHFRKDNGGPCEF